MKHFPDIIDERNGITSASPTHYADLVVGHEMTHAIMASKIKYFNKLPSFLKEGAADLTIGSDKTQTSNIRYLSKNPSVLSEALQFDYSGDYRYASGYILLRYMAKQSATSYTKTFNGTSDAETFETTNDGVTINGAGGNDSLLNGFYSTSYSLSGGDNVSLIGGADDDTINLSSGGGYNPIIYNAGDGNDSIIGISTSDTLSINGAKATRSTSGSNVIFGVGSGSITVKGGENVNFTLINAVGETFSNTSFLIKSFPSSPLIVRFLPPGDKTVH